MSKHNLSLQMKLVFAFSSIILLNIAVSLYYKVQVDQALAFHQEAQSVYSEASEISDGYQEVMKLMAQYKEEGGSEQTLHAYQTQRTDLLAQLAALENYSGTNAELYKIRAMRNSITAMVEYYDTALCSTNTQNASFYVNYYEGERIATYVPTYISGYLSILVETNEAYQETLTAQTAFAARLNSLMLLCSAVLSFFFIVAFSRMIIRPIHALSATAKQISQGEFNVPNVPVYHDDELGALTRTFNIMKEDISIAIETLLERTKLEAKLHNQEMDALKAADLLQEAQHLALQSQISPHFLFNTLNAISRAITNAPKEVAVQLVCSLAALFRYNLDHLNTFSTLKEELDVVGQYIYIQKHRFEERVRYRVDCPPALEAALVPSMLVQPLVENSLIHGIESLEHGGEIVVRVSQKGQQLRLRIYDNGVGMTRAHRDAIRARVEQPHIGHTTGIGVVNVQRRIELLQGSTMRINSAPGRGTLIEIKFPLRYQLEELNQKEGSHV